MKTVHEYTDPYRQGSCLTCGRRQTEKPNRYCRDQYHGWNAIGENAKRKTRAIRAAEARSGALNDPRYRP